MAALTPDEIKEFVTRVLAEDVGPGDWTTLGTVPEDHTLSVSMNAREGLVVAGIEVAAAFFSHLDNTLRISIKAKDGEMLS